MRFWVDVIPLFISITLQCLKYCSTEILLREGSRVHYILHFVDVSDIDVSMRRV